LEDVARNAQLHAAAVVEAAELISLDGVLAAIDELQ
jgi:hypothetical protein